VCSSYGVGLDVFHTKLLQGWYGTEPVVVVELSSQPKGPQLFALVATVLVTVASSEE
jgi:hypothetical protein